VSVGRLGVILGSGAAGLIPTGDGLVARDRHGDPYVLPHLLDHRANIEALADAGCDRILGIASVGGLRPDLGPGTYLVPDDFIALNIGPVTTLDGFEAHRVARFDEGWRREVVDAFKAAAHVEDGGVYWQVAGPRIETAAEVRLIAGHAHVVGMTVASECIVAGELGIAYAAFCVVDNLANGVTTQALTAEDVRRGQAEHRDALGAVLSAGLGALSAR
jgi:5'-methylthioadenosine phosphorylase